MHVTNDRVRFDDKLGSVNKNILMLNVRLPYQVILFSDSARSTDHPLLMRLLNSGQWISNGISP